MKNVFKISRVATIECIGIIRVLRYHCTIQVYSCKYAFRSGVGQQFCIQLHVRSCRRISSNRSCGCSRIYADFELRLQQILEALVIDGDKNKVRGLAAYLKSDAATCKPDKDRSAPSGA